MVIADVDAVLARSIEPLSFAQLLGLASRRAITRAVKEGRVVRVLPGLYASPLHAGSWQLRARAALAWCDPRALLGGTSALHARGAADAPADVTLSVPWESRPRPPAWLRIRRHVTMPEAAWTASGWPAVPPELAVIQAHSALAPGWRGEALFRPLRAGIVSVASMSEAIAAIPRFRGRPELVRRLAAASDGAESYLEEEAGSRVMVGPEFRDVVRQHRLAVGGQHYRLDAFDPASLTALEFDGAGVHGAPDRRRADIERDAILATVGIQTLRFDYRDVMDRPLWCRATAAAAIRRRRAAPQEFWMSRGTARSA